MRLEPRRIALRRLCAVWFGLVSLATSLFAQTTISNVTYQPGVFTPIEAASIQTSGTVVALAGAQVSYAASSTITLMPGFDAKPGSSFVATIGSNAIVGTTPGSSSGQETFNLDINDDGGIPTLSIVGPGINYSASDGWIQNLSFTGLPVGFDAYTIKVTDANGNASSQTVDLDVPRTAQSINISAASMYQAPWANVNDPVTFTAVGGATNAAFIWSGAVSGNGSSITKTFSNPGSYTVTLTDANNPNTTLPVSYTVQISALVNITSSSFSLNALPSLSTIQPLQPTYQLRAKFGSIQAVNQPNVSNPVLDSPPGPGTYSLALYWVQYDSSGANVLQVGPMQYLTSTVTQGGGAQGSVTITPTSSSFSSPWVNVNDAVTLTAGGGSGTGQYVWGGAASGTGVTSSVTFGSPGTYTVTCYRAADSNYVQSATASFTFQVSALVTISAVNFNTGSPPSIQTTQSLPSTYELRAKYSNSSNSVQAANQKNTNPATLDTMPPAGTYTLALYWLQYDSTGTNLLQIGPMQYFTATVTQGSGGGQAQTTPVVVTPCGTGNSLTVATGTVLLFSASGGNSTGNLVWSGAASGQGPQIQVSCPGTPTGGSPLQVTVYRAGDSTYAASNPVTVSVNVVSATGDPSAGSTQLNVLVPTP